ncbi:LAQU0S01e15368g1_1 [Lachancea quebecensis]|uniref:LAQU0S01e15368g1_1 n=1 Tax=Lachancea quebecensis TaxID=1654605 RepID=A0A0P1KM51_9SACH|nr:LAQU0S01e15368g1_1 [Lachancea quebecensis]
MLKKKGAPSSLQTFTARILGGEKLIKRLEHASLKTASSKTLSRSDIWLKEAIVNTVVTRSSYALPRSGASYPSKTIDVSLNVILSTLRRLRFANDVGGYFILLNRIKSSRVRWVSKSGKHIMGKAPIELYREVSHMLRVKSSGVQQQELVSLAKFTLELLKEYNEVLALRKLLKPDEIFLRNCADIVTRVGSITFMNAFKQLVEHENINAYAKISFYLQTKQIAHLVQFLESCDIRRDSFDLALASSLLLQCVREFVALGLEDIACSTLGLLLKQNTPNLEKPLNDVKFIAEKFGAFKVQLAINKANDPELRTAFVPWKTFQKDLSFKDYINLFDESEIDFYKETASMEFLSCKLPHHRMALKDWCHLFEDTRPRLAASASLKAFHFNTILSTVASAGSLGLVTLFWRYLIVQLNLTEDFLNSHSLISPRDYAGFHILLRSIGKSPSSKLTGYQLFMFLKNDLKNSTTRDVVSTFKLTDKDYFYLMQSTTRDHDAHSIYFYLFHYLLDVGNVCFRFDREGSFFWQPGEPILSLIKSKFSEDWHLTDLGKIVEQVGIWYKNERQNQNGASSSHIPRSVLVSIFGPNFIEELSPKTLLRLETESKNTNDSKSSSAYSLIADCENAERIKETLEHLTQTINKKVH